MSWIADEPKLSLNEDKDTCYVDEQTDCLPLPPETDPCLRLLDDEVFEKCHIVVDPFMYVSACQQDLCRSGPTQKGSCETIAAYARECARNGICIDWRTRGFCTMDWWVLKDYFSWKFSHFLDFSDSARRLSSTAHAAAPRRARQSRPRRSWFARRQRWRIWWTLRNSNQFAPQPCRKAASVPMEAFYIMENVCVQQNAKHVTIKLVYLSMFGEGICGKLFTLHTPIVHNKQVWKLHKNFRLIYSTYLIRVHRDIYQGINGISTFVRLAHARTIRQSFVRKHHVLLNQFVDLVSRLRERRLTNVAKNSFACRSSSGTRSPKAKPVWPHVLN